MKAYNACQDFVQRRQILSLLTPKYSFAYLQQFNPGYVPAPEDSDEEVCFNLHRQETNLPIYWEHKLTQHMYRQAQLHYGSHGRALAPIERHFQARRGTSFPVIMAIFQYVKSQQVTQQVAYGTYQMKINNVKVNVAKVIREQRNEELQRQISAHIKELKMDVPSRSTILTMLNIMRASHKKEVRGIHAVVEDSRRAFKNLEKIIDIIDPVAIQKDEFTKDHFEYLRQCLNTVTKYYRCHYGYNLSKHDKIASHCLNLACSDPNVENYNSPCPEEHEGSCENCEMVHKLIQTLQGLIIQLKNELDNDVRTFDIVQDLLQRSHAKIWDYQGHVMRNMLQNSAWDKLMAEKDPTKAFCTFDWAMK